MTSNEAERLLAEITETGERVRKINTLVDSITDIDSALSMIIALERKFDFIAAVVMRDDVNDQYVQMWEADDQEPGDLTDEQWETFKRSFFWRKADEIMWEGVPEAIREGLFDQNLGPS